MPHHFVVLAFLVLMLSPAVNAESKFDPGCALPFADISLHHQIDDICPANGMTLGGKPKRDSALAQDQMKNNLCAKGPAVPLTISDFVKLQSEADSRHISHGRNHFPVDRGKIKDLTTIQGSVANHNGVPIGEGKLASFTGYLVDPHYSDVDKGEGVNCKIPGKASNDIHMSLSQSELVLPKGKSSHAEKVALLCQTVVAEVIPHFRPESWEVMRLKALADNHTPVRITGQLFFDGAHNPCRDGKIGRGDPARASLFEIHPVYNIEVCEQHDLEKCKNGKSWEKLK